MHAIRRLPNGLTKLASLTVQDRSGNQMRWRSSVSIYKLEDFLTAIGFLRGEQHDNLIHATAAAAYDAAIATIFPVPCATAVCNACSARLITSVTMSTGSNSPRTTASASPALKWMDSCFSG